MIDPEIRAFCESQPCIALALQEFIDRNGQELKAFYEAHADIPREVALTMLLVCEELGYPRQLISYGSKLWRARRKCDNCGCNIPAGEYLHLFRHVDEFRFKSFFICSVCEARWDEQGECSISEAANDNRLF
jgi:hypothetical protein